jgi:hypothetical protein
MTHPDDTDTADGFDWPHDVPTYGVVRAATL